MTEPPDRITALLAQLDRALVDLDAAPYPRDLELARVQEIGGLVEAETTRLRATRTGAGGSRAAEPAREVREAVSALRTSMEEVGAAVRRTVELATVLVERRTGRKMSVAPPSVAP